MLANGGSDWRLAPSFRSGTGGTCEALCWKTSWSAVRRRKRAVPSVAHPASHGRASAVRARLARSALLRSHVVGSDKVLLRPGAAFHRPKAALRWLLRKFQGRQRKATALHLGSLEPIAVGFHLPLPFMQFCDGHLRTAGLELHYIT